MNSKIRESGRKLARRSLSVVKGLIPPEQSEVNYYIYRGIQRAYRKLTGSELTKEKATTPEYWEVMLANHETFAKELQRERHRLALREAARVFCKNEKEARAIARIFDSLRARSLQISALGRKGNMTKDAVVEQKADQAAMLLGKVRAKGISLLYLRNYKKLSKFFEPKLPY